MERTVVDGRYVLKGLLGGGGMGRVYLACDDVLERDVALKVLRGRYAQDDGFVERFEREARAAAALNYPNIVQVYDRGEAEDGTYYIAMEYVSGGTLKDRILRGPVEAGEAVRLALQIADALGVAHAGGIIHRDVKPHNVLLTADGNAKVADFGIARAASEATISNSSLVLGTAKYMSPEQAMGEPVGPESDLYSLGVVLYEMLTGEVPFEADSAVGVAMKHVSEPPRPPKEKNPNVPEALDAVTMKLLQKNPEDRYPGAAELVADLSRVGEGLPPVFVAPGAGTQETGSTQLLAGPGPGAPGGVRRDFSGARTRRRRTLLLLAATALVALLLLASLGLTRGTGGQVVGSLGETKEDAAQALGLGEEDVPARAPDLASLTPSEAQEELEQAGLRLGDRKEAPSSEVPEGKVSAQDPGAGDKTQSGTEVDLTISSGPPATDAADAVEVPDVSGRGITEAKDLLREAEYEVAGTREEPSPEPEGTVLGTDPPVGTALASGTPVVLVVSGGPGAPPAGGGAGSGGNAAGGQYR